MRLNHYCCNVCLGAFSLALLSLSSQGSYLDNAYQPLEVAYERPEPHQQKLLSNDERRKNIAAAIKDKTLNIANMIQEILNNEVSYFDIPDSFFAYMTDDEEASQVSPLMWLVLHADEDGAMGLLESDFFILGWKRSINLQNNLGKTALMLAITAPKEEYKSHLVQLLIGIGADVNHADNNGRTPLLVSMTTNCSIEVIKMLVKGGALVDKGRVSKGSTPLMYAVSKGPVESRLERVKYLVKKGADVDDQNDYGSTALMWALPKRSSPEVLEIVRYLVQDLEADVLLRDRKKQTAYDVNAKGLKRNSAICRQILLEAERKAYARYFENIE